MRVIVLLLTTLLLPVEQDPTGNWKMTIKVGHLGEGLRTVILEISEEDEGYKGQLTSMQNRMTDADEVTFDGEVLTIWYGSYEYKLKIDGDTASGSVTSPAGTQEVTANRQTSQLFAGDAPEPYQKTWRGTLEKQEDGYAIVTRRNTFNFINADAFEEQLSSLVDQDATVTGLWRIDKIEILTIEPWERGRR
jgi:hypothetical protein